MFDTLVTEYWGEVLVEEEYGRHGLGREFYVIVWLMQWVVSLFLQLL